MKIVPIKLSRIIDEKSPVRLPVNDQYLDLLMKDIGRNGMINPCVLWRLPRTGFFWFLKFSKYQIVNGFLRIEAARKLGWKEVHAVIVESNACLQ